MRTFKILAFVVIVIAMSGCQSNNMDKDPSPSVNYGGDVNGNNDVEKYKNADWLYQNYFGEYGLPEGMKQAMMPELMMMANGFALQQAQGKDVQKSINQLNMAMMMYRASGKMDVMMSNMMDEYHNDLYSANNHHNPSREQNISRNIDDEARENIEESIRREEEYKKGQEALIKNYNLPYSIPGKSTKVIEYSNAMKSSKSNGGNTKPKFSGLDEWNWYIADFFWVDGAKGIGHMGLVDSYDGLDDVYDAMPGVGVQVHTGITKYFNQEKNSGWSRVEGWWYTGWDGDNPNRKKVIRWAKIKVGRTGYGLLTWKRDRTQTYCSGFVWQGYYTRGVDLDQDGGAYVWPRDIATEDDDYTVQIFNSQNR